MDIATIRKGLGLTQAQFAERLGTSAVYVSQLETGYRRPSLKLAIRIEREFGAKGLVVKVMDAQLATARAMD